MNNTKQKIQKLPNFSIEDTRNEFWVNLGKDIGESRACGEYLKEELHKFITNDHVHLCTKVDKLDEKVDKLTVKLAAAIGAATAVIQIALFLVNKLLLK